MSTSVLIHPSPSAQKVWSRITPLLLRSLPFGLIALLTLSSLVIHGYHPNAEDGGLYAAGIKHLLDPTLYPYSRDFVEAHLRFSFFAPAIAALVRLTHLRLGTLLFALYLASVAATLTSVWLLARRCYTSVTAHIGATALTAAWLTLPVAGTSLILVDPHLTARSISLPCTLFALVAAIDLSRATTRGTKLRSFVVCMASLLLAALAHPLMAAYAVGDVIVLGCILSSVPGVKRWGAAALCLLTFAAAGIVQAFSPHESSDYVRVAITRYYWFLSRWRWYEIVGLVAPLLILAAVASVKRKGAYDPHSRPEIADRRALAQVAVASGLTAIFVALAFAHEVSAAHLVARLQPLRAFQTIYMLMILVLGAALGEHLLHRKIWHWLGTFALLGSIMFYVQRGTYPSSPHIEWREGASPNQWQQAFSWIKIHTPVNARFALDATYISQPGEDAQSFRAIAERSVLPDYSKDGGEASITPTLSAAWTAGQLAQRHLDSETDAERVTALRPFNVDWIVLQQHTQTAFACPFQNGTVKVCQLP